MRRQTDHSAAVVLYEKQLRPIRTACVAEAWLLTTAVAACLYNEYSNPKYQWNSHGTNTLTRPDSLTTV